MEQDQVAVEEPQTKDELLAEMKVATDAGDWRAVSKISSKIAKLVTSEEKAEKDAKLEKLVGVTADIKGRIDKVVGKLVADLPEDILEVMDGVWYSQDFESTETACKVSKGAVRKSGGGGGGKNFAVSTTELLKQHGSELMGETGKTYQEAYDEDTGGNSRYKVRVNLLKLAGIS